MKKILGIISLFLGLELIACIIAGFAMKVPSEVTSSIFLYKLCTVFEYFFKYLPGIILTGFTASCSVHFGHNAEGSKKRFSSAMFKRYKAILIASLICTAFLSLSQEVFTIAIKQKQHEIINRPKIIKEYVKVGNELYDAGFYNRAERYAMAALKLDGNSEAALDLRARANVEINRIYTESLRFDLTNAEPLVEENNNLVIDLQAITQSHEYYQKALAAFENSNWFDAHYNAEIGIKLTTSKDPNFDRLQELSTQAWKNLTSEYEAARTYEQEQFQQKYKGYEALVNKDDLTAYYIFRELYESSDMKHDKDVVFYYDIAKERIEQKYFFIDETLELQSFENANDVYFSYVHLGGSKDIVYFKGMSEVQETGQTIQYLRDFTIVTFDRDGSWVKTMHVPYAKVMPVSVKSINSITKNLLEIDDSTNYVPYILLKSIGRDDSNQVYEAEYLYADGEEHIENDYMLFPMAFDDFVMLENSTEDPHNAFIGSLIKFVSKSENFGYSQAMFGQIVLNRLLYPLFLLIMFVFLAAFGWNNRIGETQYFKFSWVFGFPVIIIIEVIFYELMMYVFRLINYVLLGLSGSLIALLIGFVFYAVGFILVSVYFLGRKNS